MMGSRECKHPEGEWPLVSITTPMYNTGREVLETIDSIRKSSYPNVEHLIVDDASTDDSVELVRAYLEETGHSARLVVHSKNQGIAATRQHLLALAQGEFVVGVSDDLVRPDRIAQDVRCLMAADEDVVGVFSLAQTFLHGTNEVLGIKGKWNGETDSKGRIDPRELAERLLESNFIAAMTCTLRRKVVVDVGYDTRFFIDDYPMWVRLLKAGYSFAYRDVVSMDYRITSNSVRQGHASRIALDALKSKVMFEGSGLIPDRRVHQEAWQYFWSKLTVFNSQHRRLALQSLRDMKAAWGIMSFTAVRYVSKKLAHRPNSITDETLATTIRK